MFSEKLHSFLPVHFIASNTYVYENMYVYIYVYVYISEMCAYIYIYTYQNNVKTRHARGDRAESLQGEQRPSIHMDLMVRTTRSLAFLSADSKADTATVLSPCLTFSS